MGRLQRLCCSVTGRTACYWYVDYATYRPSPQLLTQEPSGPQPVTYGSEVILTDTLSGISTSPLTIRKVDKGRIAPDDGGPVSQMQKIALQRTNTDGTRHYLSAASPVPGQGATPGQTPANQTGTHPLVFQAPRVREETRDGVRVITDEVDDYLCWTIVGICTLLALEMN